VKVLSLQTLLEEANLFSEAESQHDEPLLYGVDNGKAIGTYIEHKFVTYLRVNYSFSEGNSASGIDFPSLEIDIKVTSVRQPQSSSPFRFARQKIYGLGYHLLIFVYLKSDDPAAQTARLDMLHTIFVDRSRTADYQMTRGLLHILSNEGNADDLVAFMLDRNLPVDEIEANNLAEEVLRNPPLQGYLTISNALQWRLQYGRVISQAGEIEGIVRIR
jgi:hypothetical protein